MESLSAYPRFSWATHSRQHMLKQVIMETHLYPPHQCIFFIKLVWLLSLIWSKKKWKSMNTKGLHWLFQSRKQLSSFSEWCIGLSVFVYRFVCSVVPSLWHGEMEVFKRSLSYVGIVSTNLWAFKGETREWERPLKVHVVGMFSSRVRRWSLYILMFCCLYCDISS